MFSFGIMTARFRPASKTVRRLIRYAHTAGFRPVFVFTPFDVNWRRRTIMANVYRNKRWIRLNTRFPLIAHDIGYYSGKNTIARVKRLKYKSSITFTGHGLGNKAQIEAILRRHPLLAEYVIPGMQLENECKVSQFLSEYGRVMVKPNGGSKGRGIKRVTRCGSRFIIEENGKKSVSISSRAMHRRWDGWKRQDRFLVQQWINLAGNDGRPCDIRVHLHKDGTGQWRLGGMGVREAAAGKITSNVHSGGKVHEVIPYLSRRFGEEKASAMAQQCERLAFVGAEHLEQTKNERLNELGFDFGIDVEGRIWLIEVNIKPGRHTIRTLYGAAGAKRCLQAQIDYARYLLNQLPTPRAKNARSV